MTQTHRTHNTSLVSGFETQNRANKTTALAICHNSSNIPPMTDADTAPEPRKRQKTDVEAETTTLTSHRAGRVLVSLTTSELWDDAENTNRAVRTSHFVFDSVLAMRAFVDGALAFWRTTKYPNYSITASLEKEGVTPAAVEAAVEKLFALMDSCADPFQVVQMLELDPGYGADGRVVKDTTFSATITSSNKAMPVAWSRMARTYASQPPMPAKTPGESYVLVHTLISSLLSRGDRVATRSTEDETEDEDSASEDEDRCWDAISGVSGVGGLVGPGGVGVGPFTTMVVIHELSN